MAVERIIELVTHPDISKEQLYFLEENCQRLMNVLTSLSQGLINALTALEAKDTPLACSVFNMMEDLQSYVSVGRYYGRTF